MSTVTIPAHFDAKHIVLDEPYDLPANASLLVTVLPVVVGEETNTEEAWLKAATANKAFDFLADDAEDIYTLADGKPLKPEG